MRILSVLLTSLLFLPVFGQTTREEMIQNPNRCGGIYYAYPTPSVQSNDIPTGYEPFYISHYGRHGSRYLIPENDYLRVLTLLDKAQAENALTPLGKEFRERMQIIFEEARGRDGELTPLGNRQHHDIASRMFTAYPQVFTDDAEITAQSTQVMRCAYSMFSFTEALKEKNPNLNIPRESSRRNMDFLCWWTKESENYNTHDESAKAELASFRKRMTKPARLIGSIFSSDDFVKNNLDPQEFMWWVYWVAVDLQNMETDITLTDIITPEELFNLWQVFNFDFYIHNSAYPESNGVHVNNAKHLLRNIIDKADEYIGSNKKGASLRFGHDGNITPLLALMQVSDCYGEESCPDSLLNTWNDFHVSPMAANVQLIFLHDNDNNVIVKVLHNESPVKLNIPSDLYPYYRWDTLRAYLTDRLNRSYNEFMKGE